MRWRSFVVEITNWDAPVRRGSYYPIFRPLRTVVVDIVVDCIRTLRSVVPSVSTYYRWSDGCLAVNFKTLRIQGNCIYVCELISVEDIE